MTWTDAVRASTMAQVGKVCIECGDVYYIRKVAVGRSVRCPPCQQARDIARRNASRKERYYRERKGHHPRLEAVYKLVYDPCGGWTRHTEFTDMEMKLLLKLHYIEVGAMLDRRGVRLIVAQTDRGDLCLEEM